jgi:hypothetical protein
VDAADTPQSREVRQHEAQISTRFALPARKLRASAAALGPRLAARFLSRAPGSRDAVTPAFPLSGRPPSVGAGEDVLDIVVDQHNVKIPALLTVVLGQFRVNLPLDPVGRLLLAQEDEVVELGGMVAISIGWQPDRNLCGYGQSLDNAAVIVVRDTNDHKDSPFQIDFGQHVVLAGQKRRQGYANSGHVNSASYWNKALAHILAATVVMCGLC